MRVPGGGPQLGVRGEALLDIHLRHVGMADRRHAADREAGARAHELGIRLADRLADDA